jgi:aspartate 1-decarboxylase
MIKLIRSKLHGLRVTDANLNYQGSITLDPVQCKIAKIFPLEFVEIWNKTSGARISTYVIFGKPNSKCCVLNGAAARTCQPGDELIIATSHYMPIKEAYKTNPIVLTFNEDNSIKSFLEYEVTPKDDFYEFNILEKENETICPNLNILEKV